MYMKKKRLLAGLLALILCVGMLPAAQATVDTSALTNISRRATITHSGTGACDQDTWVDGDDSTESGFYGAVLPDSGGNAWVQFDFGQDYPVGKIRLAAKADNASHWYYCDILTKASADADWTTRAENQPVKRIANENAAVVTLEELTNIQYVKVVLHQGGGGSWGALSELQVFADMTDVPEPEDPNAPEGCINVIQDCTITVPSKQEDADKIRDGNTGTQWAAGSGDFPANVDFALPSNLLVKKIQVEFQHYEGRTFDLNLRYAVNNVIDTFNPMEGSAATHDVNQTYSYELPEATRMTNVRVQLTATNGQAWPAIAEVRIYVVDEKLDLNNFKDIAVEAAAAENTPTVTKAENVYTVDFGSNQQVAGFKLALPAGTTGYKIEGKLKKGDWKTYINDGTAEDTERVLNYVTGMSAVRLTLTGANVDANTKFEVWGNYVEPFTDSGNLAFEKPTHSNFSNDTSYLVTDGGKTSSWTAEVYPVYVDIDLEQNCDISEIEVYTPSTGYTQYSVYTSLNGRDFSLFADKQDKNTCDETTGDVHHKDTPVTARVVRVYLEYYSKSSSPVLNEVRVLGAKSSAAYVPTPAVNINDFSKTSYAAEITEADTIAEVQGIVERQVGKNYVNWFTFDIQPKAANGYDYFTLTDEGGKVKITGNNGVSLATGLNHYLKYFCNVHISQVGNQVHMPDAIVPVNGTVHKETEFPVRYAYNYCTHSYSMSFWNEPEWRNELDWLALNGVNVVLDITGQEAVWYKFLTDLDIAIPYTAQDAKDFLAGPGYYAWAYMANLTGLGGPIHDSFLEERMELGRKNQRIMRTLGMEPVLQAFSGMVPVDITTHDPAASVIGQGTWSGCQRPTMLQTNTQTYTKYAKTFYNAQKYIFGDAKYYATDPFHEGGNTGGMNTTVIASCLLDSLLSFDSDAVWVIQSWQGNPSNGLLAGLRGGENPTRVDRRDHALVLDLYAERVENWRTYGEDVDGDGVKEFSDTPWVWCMLNNFGGRMGLHGYLDYIQQRIPAAANSTQHMKGVGITPEGSQENPVLYDFLYETIWTDDASADLPVIDLDQWLADYARRRYGAESESAVAALGILKETVYNGAVKDKRLGLNGNQGAPESVINARPRLDIGSASTWGYSYIYYDKAELEKAARLLLADYDTLSASDAYLYDVADVLKQVLSNSAQEIHSSMAAAFRAGDAAEFETQSTKFLEIIDMSNRVMSTRKEFLFGKWTDGAVQMAKNTDDFTKRLYLRNAKALVTTWGSYNQCSTGLCDYSNRQWAGLTNDFYKARWEQWIAAAKEKLESGSTTAPSFDWFPWEWEYARSSQQYSNEVTSTDSLKTLGETVLREYATPVNPAADDTNDLTAVSATASSAETSEESNPASNVLDGDISTIWHTTWSSTAPTPHWITLDLGEVKTVNGLRYLPRSSGGTNGIITGYKVYTSTDNAAWSEAATGTWAQDSKWKMAQFTETEARYVKLECVQGAGGYASAAEIRVTGPAAVTPPDPASDLVGTVTISGSAIYGETLTATVTGAQSDATLAYQWSRGGNAITGATRNTYAITQEDIGAALTCTVTDSSGTYQGAITATTAAVTKAVGPAAPTGLIGMNPTTVDGTDGSIFGLESGKNYEISSDNGLTWTAAAVTNGMISGLGKGAYLVRLAETATQLASNPTIVTLTDPLPPVHPDDVVITPPTDLAVSDIKTDSAVLSWTAATSNAGGIVGYQIYLNDSATPVKTAIRGPVTLTDLSAQTTYTVRLVAVDAQGNFAPDATITFTTATASRPGTGTPGGSTSTPGGPSGPSGRPNEGTTTQTQTGEDGSVTTIVTDNATGTVTTTIQQSSGRELVKVATPGEGLTMTLTAPTTGEVLAEIALPEVVPPAEKVFEDVPETHWAKESVDKIAALGLVKGTSDTIFSDAMEMNRGMMATVLHRLSGEIETAKADFTDVQDNAYYAKAVDWASTVGVLKGINAETYAPDQAVSRQELALMLYRYAEFLSLDTKVSQEDLLDDFVDKDKVADWTGDSMAWAVDKGLLKGRGGSELAPEATATRAEVAVILDRFLSMIQ